jgi:alginate O-acetyltransferase complex protein AlgJ
MAAFWMAIFLTCGWARGAEAPGGAGKSASFQERCARLAEAAARENKAVVRGRDGWLFLASELRHLGAGRFWGEAAAQASAAANPDWADPLPAILDFNEQMRRAGILLVLMPVPPRAVLYPDKLAGDDSSPDELFEPTRMDAHLQEFYRLLGEKGVLVLDITPQMLEARKRDETLGPVCCRTDSHWSPRGCALAAGILAARASEWQEKGVLPTLPGNAAGLAAETRDLEITGDLARMLEADPGAFSEKIPAVLFVGSGEAGAQQPVKPDAASPILLMGDSHCLVFHASNDMHATGAGLLEQLAYGLTPRHTPDLLGVRGSGATTTRLDLRRRAVKSVDYLPGKKVIVWCFAARDFTESQGWRMVPVVGSK